MKKCIVFSRVSSDHQDIVQQTDEVLAEAKKQGYRDSEIEVIEHKESAIKLDEEERIGLSHMKECIESNPIECVFVYEISRISRRPKVIYSIRDLLVSKKIQMVCLKPYMKLLEDGSLSQTASIMFSIFASLSESEMMIKKERMRRGAEHAKAMGRHAGGHIMFGYKTDKSHRYEIDPVKGPIVRRIFEEYAYKGTSMKKLARDLQEEGIFSDVKLLTAQQEIYNILHRECYCGRKNGMPAIISEELYEASCAKRKSNQLKVNNVSNMSLLKGLLYDADNGLLLSSNSALKMYYSKREKGCAVSMHIIEPFIWEYAVSLHKMMSIDGIRMLEAKMSRRMGMIFNIRAEQVRKKAEIREKIDKTEERLIMGKISEKKAEEIERMLENEIKQIEDRARELNAEFEELNKKSIELKSKGKIDIDYDNMDKQERYDAVHSVISKIMIRRPKRIWLEVKIFNKLNDEVKEFIIDCSKKCLLK